MEEVETLARTGRPKSENPKSNRIIIRVTDEDYVKLKEYTDRHNIPIAQAVRDGVKMLIDSEK